MLARFAIFMPQAFKAEQRFTRSSRLAAASQSDSRTSKSPCCNHFLTLRWVAGPNRSRATDPLYGIGTALPPDTT